MPTPFMDSRLRGNDDLSVLNLKEESKMRRHKLVGLLLLGAFIFTMGFNEPAFATDKLTKILNTLDEIKAQIQTHDGGDSTDHTGLLNKLGEIQDLIQPVWSRVMPAAERFQLVMNDEAVLDRETGLVWERSPDTTQRTWASAIAHCYAEEVGGRKGWRLPTIEELASLIDTTQPAPTLPAGHPFLNVQSDWYWSATTSPFSTSSAWVVNFNNGIVGSLDESNGFYVWCVRGGHGYDAY